MNFLEVSLRRTLLQKNESLINSLLNEESSILDFQLSEKDIQEIDSSINYTKDHIIPSLLKDLAILELELPMISANYEDKILRQGYRSERINLVRFS
jgi:hypothetical protein